MTISALETHIDHLVVAARTLDEGVAWCEATLGITPNAGGEHEKYGTHNRLFKIATPRYPMAYFEIIAIHPVAICKHRKGWWCCTVAAFDAKQVELCKPVLEPGNTYQFVQLQHALA